MDAIFQTPIDDPVVLKKPLHPVLQAAIDNPRFPARYNYDGDFLPSWQPGRYVSPPNYLADLLLLSDETLIPDNSPLKIESPKITIERPDGKAAKPISIIASKAVKKVEGAPLTARAANDNEKGTPWPLYDEYVAERLGRDAYANSKNWNTAMWIDKIYAIAMLPPIALGPPHWVSSALCAEALDGYKAESVIPPEAVALLSVIEKIERIKRKEIGCDPVGTHEVSTSKDTRLPTGVEIRADANKILRLLQVGMRGLWRPVKLAIVDHVEIWTLGITQGVSRGMAPTAGRQRILDGLSIAADIRQDVLRWEGLDHRVEEGTCSPLGRKASDLPAKWRQAANVDCRALKVA